MFGGRSPASDHICKVPFGKGVLSAVCVCKERTEFFESGIRRHNYLAIFWAFIPSYKAALLKEFGLVLIVNI